MNKQQGKKLTNPLIVKEQAGKTKPTVYDLPDSTHAYGKKVPDDPQPIKYVVNGWLNANESPQSLSNQRDFRRLNKMSIQNQVTAKDQTNFRKYNDVKVQTKKGQRVMPILLPEEEFSYGVVNRPSTPVKLVIGNCYALEAERAKQEAYLKETQKMQSQANKKCKALKTKSQMLREQKANQDKQYRQKPNIDPQFKMEKFQKKATTKVDTRLILETFKPQQQRIEPPTQALQGSATHQ